MRRTTLPALHAALEDVSLALRETLEHEPEEDQRDIAAWAEQVATIADQMDRMIVWRRRAARRAEARLAAVLQEARHAA